VGTIRMLRRPAFNHSGDGVMAFQYDQGDLTDGIAGMRFTQAGHHQTVADGMRGWHFFRGHSRANTSGRFAQGCRRLCKYRSTIRQRVGVTMPITHFRRSLPFSRRLSKRIGAITRAATPPHEGENDHRQVIHATLNSSGCPGANTGDA